jgi:hypothetical protein
MADDMKHFVHLKDGVVFAHHQSPNEVDVEGDNIIEVDGNEEDYLLKKYENGQFSNAPLLRYAILDKKNNNTVIGIETTYFSSDVKDNVLITDPDVDILWTWNGTTFDQPNKITPLEIIKAEVYVEPAEVKTLRDATMLELEQSNNTQP